MEHSSVIGGKKRTKKQGKGKGRKVAGGSMLVDVAASALLLGLTQIMKRRPGTAKYVTSHRTRGGSSRRHRRR